MKALTLKELRSKTDEEIIALHDAHIHALVNVDYFLNELHRRDSERVEARMLKLTERSTNAAIVAAILSLAALIVAIAGA